MNKTMITQNNITYLIKNEEAIVFCYLGNDKNIIIPDYIYSNDVKYPVTQVSKKCFQKQSFSFLISENSFQESFTSDSRKKNCSSLQIYEKTQNSR